MYYRRAPNLAWRKVVDDTIVVDLEKRHVVGLNDAGAWVLEALEQPRSSAELAEALATDAVTTGDFLTSLTEAGVIEAVAAGPGESSLPVIDTARFAAPRVLWRETLEAVVHVSPSMDVGELGCDQ